jgi:flagellar biosynthetic protein FliR
VSELLLALAMGKAMAFALASCRVTGFVMTSPFPGSWIGTTPKIGLVVALSLVVGSTLPPMPVGHAASTPVMPLDEALTELMVGGVIGFGFRILLSAADMLGTTAAEATGLSGAAFIDPVKEAQESPIGRVLSLFALLLAVAAGVHRIALAYLLESFRALPIGAHRSLVPSAWGLAELAGHAFYVGARLGMPLVAAALVIQVALAMVARAAPSLQIFSIGFAVLAVAGSWVLLASLGTIATHLLEELRTLPLILDRLLAPSG